MDAVLTIAPPPCAIIWGISYFRQSQTPLRLTLMTRSQSSSVQSTMFPNAMMPALLWAQSRRPYDSTACAISAATSLAFVTSVWTKVASPPLAAIIRTVSSPPARAISETITRAPARANAIADALPMPEPAPVTSATFPANVAVGAIALFAIMEPPQVYADAGNNALFAASRL